MTGISIDLNNYVKVMDNVYTKAFSKAVTNGIETGIYMLKDKWQMEAQKKLRSTRPQYLLGLDINLKYLNNIRRPVGIIFLKGTLPNMIENGYSSFDMKVGFSRSNRKKMNKNGGWYLTIPYRHSTPNSFMYGNAMPKNIYNRARKLGSNDKLRVQGGQRTSWTGYRHKSNIYDALTRIIQQNAKKTQSQYNTYRRVSSNSDPLSWMHPGYKGVKIAKSLTPYAKQIFKNCVRANLIYIFK